MIRVGLAIGRRSSMIVAVQDGRIVYEREGEKPGDLLSGLPASLKVRPITVGLHSGLAASDDAWPAPSGFKTRELSEVVPVLLEARAAGETLEGLSVDARLEAGSVMSLGVPTEALRALLAEARACGLRIGSVTSLAAALAQVYSGQGGLSLVWAGMRIEVASRASWESSPLDRPMTPEEESARVGDLSPAQKAGFAVATADVEALPNALRGLPEAPRALGQVFYRPLVGLGLAASLLLLALGTLVRAHAERARLELEAADALEAGLLSKHFPGRPAVRGELSKSVREKVRETGQTSQDAGAFPSAFRFFREIGKYLPEVEPLGLALETIDVTPEGGRLVATVEAPPKEPLKNAALLEGRLNDSPLLIARGDFESREKDVQVRLKLDYRSR
jgi:hypothetical protein